MAEETKAIRIDMEVFLILQKHAEPFDTPNNTLRKLLGMPTRPRKKAGRKKAVKTA